jgi:DNA processing protein
MFDSSALSLDAQAIVMACSSLGAPRDDAARPLGPRTWSAVARRLDEAQLTPSDLVGMDEAALARAVGDAVDASRLRRLLRRAGPLAVELERVRSRGIWVVTIADERYPERVRTRLGPDAPPVLFGAGDRQLLGSGGVAVVGSRDVDEAGLAFAELVASGAARSGVAVVSGGAKGVDQTAMRAAARVGGPVVGVLPEGVERRIRDAETRAVLGDGLGVVTSPYHPAAGFSAGAAMARNKLIYALSDVAVVIAASAGSGGTWTGAVEALRAGWVPVLARVGADAPAGNQALVAEGARPLSPEALAGEVSVPALLAAAGPAVASGQARVAEGNADYEQQSLSLAD